MSSIVSKIGINLAHIALFLPLLLFIHFNLDNPLNTILFGGSIAANHLFAGIFLEEFPASLVNFLHVLIGGALAAASALTYFDNFEYLDYVVIGIVGAGFLVHGGLIAYRAMSSDECEPSEEDQNTKEH